LSSLRRVRSDHENAVTSIFRPDGSIFGEGEGINLTQDGEGISWKGMGVGKFGPNGSISYRGMLFFRTNSEKISLGSACGAFEYYHFQGLGVAVGKELGVLAVGPGSALEKY
jgi:hypothetical protein